MTAMEPADEMQGVIVAKLRADTILEAMLFPTWAPSLAEYDRRIYGANVELPAEPNLLRTLPRVLVETTGRGADVEQLEAEPLQGEVNIYVHVLTPREEEQLAGEISARCAIVLLSTPPLSDRIIAAPLAYDGIRRKTRVGAFNDAWEIVSQYRCPHVGVLV